MPKKLFGTAYRLGADLVASEVDKSCTALAFDSDELSYDRSPCADLDGQRSIIKTQDAIVLVSDADLRRDEDTQEYS